MASSNRTVPEGFENMPRTLVSTCLQTNPTEEFSGSISHLEVCGRAGAYGICGPAEPDSGGVAAPELVGSIPAGAELPSCARPQLATAKTMPRSARALWRGRTLGRLWPDEPSGYKSPAIFVRKVYSGGNDTKSASPSRTACVSAMSLISSCQPDQESSTSGP